MARYLKSCGVEVKPLKIVMHRCRKTNYGPYDYDTVVDGWHYIVSPTPRLDGTNRVFWELIYEASPPNKEDKVYQMFPSSYLGRMWTEEDLKKDPYSPQKVGKYYGWHGSLQERKEYAIEEIAKLVTKRRNGEEF